MLELYEVIMFEGKQYVRKERLDELQQLFDGECQAHAEFVNKVHAAIGRVKPDGECALSQRDKESADGFTPVTTAIADDRRNVGMRSLRIAVVKITEEALNMAECNARYPMFAAEFELLRRGLLLPHNCSVTGVSDTIYPGLIAMRLQSPDFKETEPGVECPTVEPFYKQDADGKTVFSHWEGEAVEKPPLPWSLLESNGLLAAVEEHCLEVGTFAEAFGGDAASSKELLDSTMADLEASLAAASPESWRDRPPLL